jgi:hypothetical protein
LTHFQLSLNKEGEQKIDDIGRPKLHMRPDDFMLTGFFEVVRRHGEFAGEAKAVREVHTLIAECLKTALEQKVKASQKHSQVPEEAVA